MMSQCLDAEIGGRVDEDDSLLALRVDETQPRGGSGAIVPGIGAAADFAITADDGNPGRGAGAKDDEFEIRD